MIKRARRLWQFKLHTLPFRVRSLDVKLRHFLRLGRLILRYGPNTCLTNGMCSGNGMLTMSCLLGHRSILTLFHKLKHLNWSRWTSPFGPSQVLKSSKPHSMRGVDGWSFAELKLIPRNFVDVLLQLFHWCEQTCTWPKVFQTWLAVLLRKVPTGIVSWKSVRPISVAATLYRMWSKMRTAQLMQHARTLATSTVRPCLSTRSIWGFQVELIAEFLSNSISPCGLVLDLIKAFNDFNVICRPFLQALMLRLGFQPTIVLAWFSCLQGLSRQALVAGAVYGTSHASTGIPEGDPLPVVGMFALCCLFREVVVSQDPLAFNFPFSYADNWEVVTGALTI